MPIYLNTNVWSLNAQRALALSQTALMRSLERSATGLRINRASDDPTGHAIVERQTAQINGMDQATRNVNQAVTFTKHVDSNLETIHTHLQAVRTKIVEAQGASSNAQRQTIQEDINVRLVEIDRLANSVEFDGRKVLNGDFTRSLYQVGPNAADTIEISTGNFRSGQFGLYRVEGHESSTASASGSARSKEKLTIAGYLGSRTFETGDAGSATSVKTIAEQTNALAVQTGVRASARTEVDITGWAATTGGTYKFSIQGDNIGDATTNFDFSVGPAVVASGNPDFASGIATFNASLASLKSGVTMRLNNKGDGITLINEKGNNIVLSNGIKDFNPSNLSLAGSLGGATITGVVKTDLKASDDTTVSRTVSGQILFESEKPFSVKGETVGTPAPDYKDANTLKAATSAVKAVTYAAVVVPILKLNVVETARTDGRLIPVTDNIRDALLTIDGAITTVTNQQTALGATENRLSSIIDNLEDDTVHLKEARGHIRDADLILEDAIQDEAINRYQVALAILSKASLLQQAVLALLK